MTQTVLQQQARRREIHLTIQSIFIAGTYLLAALYFQYQGKIM